MPKATVLIQGASRGIGLEFVRQLLKRKTPTHVIATCSKCRVMIDYLIYKKNI